MNRMVQVLHRRVSPILVLSTLALLAASNPVHAQFTDSLWVMGGQGSPGDLIQVEVWMQYEGGGVTDSVSYIPTMLTETTLFHGKPPMLWVKPSLGFLI